MKTICRMLKRDSKGFTLVELMVVLLIIGILIAIAIPIYNATQRNAKEKACRANIRTIESAVSQYHAEHKKWPKQGVIGEDHELKSYLKEIPTCPFDTDDEPSYYEVDENGTVSCGYNDCETNK
ncbi:MAG: prepilin-type N-terminal cleavage/methylation domain-containing protein [Thermoanaerobacterales bacterium]|nr:prepilin-type N-terminal cleavage/methylation domain-containing protein [Thermoanaerobacterales bacterium]